MNQPGASLPSLIIPVHNAPEELDRCLASVAATVPADIEVIVIDDASQDEAVQKILARWQQGAGSHWRFLFQQQNLGFVATVNRGMAMTRGDVVLLNSDTEVTTGWLEGLSRCLASDSSIATATPWTNNGEIVSLPRFCEVNPPPADREAVARIIARTGTACYPELPTAVGYCMAISRHALDKLGLFDEETFGIGYGEENDFSMRAQQAGMRNVLCDDVYVVHLGGRSFGPLGLKPDEASMQRLLARHPDYLRLVQAFIHSDPLAPRRQELARALGGAVPSTPVPEQNLSNPLEFTGERFTPECIREISYEHVHRYVFAAELVRNKKVLDAACGEGYGSAHLARTAQSVSAVDISEEAISHARARYRSENLDYRVADCCQLPFEDNQFECIVSFETLEHLQDQSGLLREFRRVLEPAGFLLLSSPDKAVYTDRYHNENEFHVRELYRDELDALLAEQFPARSLLRQKLLFYSAIWSEEAGSRFTLHQSGEDEVSARTDPGHEAMYYIAVCAADEAALPQLDGNLWLFDDARESVYEHYQHEIRKNMSAGNLLASMERELEQLRSRLEAQSSTPSEATPWWRRLIRSP